MKNISLLLALVLFCSVASAQDRIIKGKVTDKETGKPLGGATVLADKSKSAIVTATDGSYSITVGPKSTALSFSYVGYSSQKVTIGTQTVINTTLASSTDALSEVVVIGYGTQKKREVTGAVSKYKNEKMDETPVSNLDQALQGKIAGVAIQNVSSEAGSETKIHIRGIGSVNAGTGPLVVVDGHPVPDGLQFVNMADVESVEVLKDAASAAIYGSRGANGVILVTTKSGKADKPKFTLKFSTGFKTAYETYPMLSTTAYTNQLYYEASLKAQDPSIPAPTAATILTGNERAAYIIENTLEGGNGTDWQQAVLRNALVRNIQLNFSGGKKEVRYYVSGGVQKDQGLMKHSEYDKYSFRTKVDIDLSKKMKASFNFNPSYISREKPSTGYIDFVRFQSFLPVYHTAATAAFVNQNPLWTGIKAGDFAQARHFNATFYNGYMPDGSYYTSTAALDPFNTANNTPMSILESRNIKTNEYRALTSGDLTYTIIPGLEAKTMGSIYVTYANTVDYSKRNALKDGDINKGIFGNRLYIDLLSENTLNYSKTKGDHSFTALAGFTVQKTRIKNEQTTGFDFPSDNIQSLSTALTISSAKADTYNDKLQIGLISYLGRLTYAYKSRYLLNASFRTDGSSRFGPGQKYGSFPAVSLGWIASQEKFLENAKGKWLDNLKFRASYGATGNNGIGEFLYTDLLTSANNPSGSGNGTSSAGLAFSGNILGNPNITWERTFQLNTGFDLSVLKGRYNLTVDYYNSRTEKLLLYESLQSITGYLQTVRNIGKLDNRGIEIELTSNNVRKKDFRWTTTGNFAHTQNKVVSLPGGSTLFNYGERTEVYINQVGAPLVQFFGYKTDGVWLSQAQIDDAKAKGLKSNLSNLFVPGGLKLVDTNGDNVIDEKDRVVTGNPYPDFTWGITNNITWKALDLTFTFQGSQGGQLVNGDGNYNEIKRYNKNYNTNRWLSPMFPGDGKTPYSTNGFNWLLTDYAVEDASYYALREVVIGYSLPKTFSKRMHVSNVRFYLSAQNLYFHSASGYRGINAEGRFASSGPYANPAIDGYQRGSFPMPKTYLFGIDIGF